MALEDLLKQGIWDSIDFYLSNAGLSQQRNRLENAPMDYIVDSSMHDYARFEILSNGKDTKYALRFRPEAVADKSAIAEEAAHATRLILNDVLRNRLLKAGKDTGQYEKMVALEEYGARYAALAYLNHLKITKFNKLWLEVAGGNLRLHTNKPSDALSHFYGYTQAEINYGRNGIGGLSGALLEMNFSALQEAYQLQKPKIVEIAA